MRSMEKCVVTGEAGFAFYGRPPAAKLPEATCRGCERHMYIIDNSLVCTLAQPATLVPPEKSCFQRNDCLA
jgi:hypothetical protein